ncbi:MAG: aminotransferase class I/II-fold pyridoxal phosphate-dependent enzyme, partial [Comamonas sp.]
QRIAALTDAKLLSGLTTSELGERVVHRILADGLYRKHVLRLRERLDEARQRCLKFVNTLGLEVHQEPNAGMFVWVDAGRDTELLARKAAVDGVLLAPGVLFSAHQQPSTMLRLPVSMVDSAAERSALTHLLK